MSMVVAAAAVAALSLAPPVAAQQCVRPSRRAPAQQLYRIGVLANRGADKAFAEFNETFANYLTYTAGRKFDPPLTFEMAAIPLDGRDVDAYESGDYDFMFANPTIYSCVESEVGANSLVSLISRRSVGGQVHDLVEFGGVIITLADNDEIETIADIRGKRIATASVTGLGSGQMQFRELHRAGLHHFQDPKQIIFMENQDLIVNAVLRKDVDVGFIRTDQLERSIDERTGDPVDLSTVKIVGAREGLVSHGSPFPFITSTPLYPEWGFASLPNVDGDVAQAVQSSMLAMSEHADVGILLESCFADSNCTHEDVLCRDKCASGIPLDAFRSCDTTTELALLAANAVTVGRYAGWRTTLSYMELRNMQQEIGFIRSDKASDKFRCARSTEIGNVVACPPGHFQKSAEDIETGCEQLGLDCFGFQCICSPCVEAYNVDFFPVYEETSATDDAAVARGRQGCSKFAVCGVVAQHDEITFRAVDNKRRSNATFWANVVTDGDERDRHTMTEVVDPMNGEVESIYTYEFLFNAQDRPVGIIIVEVFVDGEQIPESPFRVKVAPKDCSTHNHRVPDAQGNCVCASGTTSIGSTCVAFALLLPCILVPLGILVAIAVYLYVDRKSKQADAVWLVRPSELFFHENPRILGRGTFGLVLLAEYRGTQVAVKRVLPARDKAKTRRREPVPMDDGMPDLGEDDEDSFSDEASRASALQETYPKSSVKSRTVTFDIPEGLKSTGRKMFSLAASVGILTGDGRKSHFDFLDKAQDEEQGNNLIPESFASSGSNVDAMARNHSQLGLKSGVVPQMLLNGTASYTAKPSMGSKSSSSIVSTWKHRRTTPAHYSQLQKDFRREMRSLSKLRHPNIVTVMGACLSPNTEPMLVMEYMQLGSLHDLLHNDTMPLEGEMVLNMLRDIAQGMRFLHSASPQVIHGDLKAQNILVDSKLKAKVSDFGLSQKSFFRRSATGTPFWMAPELIRGESTNTAASDIYAFGIVLYEVFARKEPYDGEHHVDVLRQVADKSINKRPPVPKECPADAANLMRACLLGDPEARPTAEDVDVRLKQFAIDDSALTSFFSAGLRGREEAERSEDLLSQLFPKKVADALCNGRKVEPESFDNVTVFFSDIVGFTQISSNFTPTKVSELLDRLYTKFDALCGIHNVFKVETVGDAYMCVTNLATSQPEHARIMVYFALDAIEAASHTLVDEDDPSKGYLQIRVGIHSGPVVAHVIGSRTPRYSVIGDTVNTASRMESNSLPGKIHSSEETAKMLKLQAPDMDVAFRGTLFVKGKGDMLTYWVRLLDPTEASDMRRSRDFTSPTLTETESSASLSQSRTKLIDWNFSVMQRLLRQIVARRAASKTVMDQLKAPSVMSNGSGRRDQTVLEEVKEVIELPEYKQRTAKREKGIDTVKLQAEAERQLRHFITSISLMYRDNAFHSFEHASHVTMAVMRFLSRVIDPSDMKESQQQDRLKVLAAMHEFTGGISSDPLTQFALAFSGLIHDVDHPGVPNTQLAKENTTMARLYKGQSLAEQNSVDLSWRLLMDERYSALRNTIFQTNKEKTRFRQLVVNCVMATDIVDKDLKALRNARWEKAFNDAPLPASSEQEQDEIRREASNRKATIVIEHLIQASDVAHMMQHWQIYRKWNERLFQEMHRAYLSGRSEKDPAEFWYQGELGFFDFYIIPLAKKLKECGVFGVMSDECLNYAINNRKLWEDRGQEVLAQYLEAVNNTSCTNIM